METFLLIKLQNGFSESVKSGSVLILPLGEIHKDFWLQTDKAVFVNFPKIKSEKSEIFFESVSEEKVKLSRSKLEGIIDLNLTYDTFFMRLVVSLIILFDNNSALVLNSVGISSDLKVIEKIFKKYLKSTGKSLVIVDSFS